MILAFSSSATATLLASLVAPSQAPVTNAPVSPDAIYLGRIADRGGLSIVDLNGFGAGTGDPIYDQSMPIVEGGSNYPNNPNLALQGFLMIPRLAPGNSTRNGGSSGVFTLVRDSALYALLARGMRVPALMLGHPLALVSNNGFCNICSGLQIQSFGFAPPHALVPDPEHPIHRVFVSGNPISWAPHPNTPPLLAPGDCAFAVEV